MYIYSDTDSIKTLLPVEELKQFCDIDDVKLGAWKNEGIATKTLYSGTTIVDGNISHYSTGDNYLTYSSGGKSKTLYFVDKASVSGLSEVSFTASAIYGGSSGSIEEIYGADPPAIDDSIFDKKTEWYEYDDKVLSVSPQTGKENRIFVGIVVVCGKHKYIH